MNTERFSRMVRERSRQEVEQMMRNAISKNQADLAKIAKQALDERFPGWDKVRSKAGGARPTRARFKTESRSFPTSKEAYVWLLERLIPHAPELFHTDNWQMDFVAKGRKRSYFSRDIKEMFSGSPHLADDRNNYARLTNGWCANTNLNNSQKFDILGRIAAIGKVEPEDWEWTVDDPSDELRSKIARQAEARRLLDELAVFVKAQQTQSQ